MKTVLIPFTSGLDSTYLIYNAMKEGLDVRLFVTKLLNNKMQTRAEDFARKKILRVIKSEKFLLDYDLRGRVDERLIINKIEVSGMSRLRLAQPPMWILGSLYSMPSDVDEIWFGYVGGDDALGYLDDIREIYKSLECFLSPGEKFPDIVFPLKRNFKFDLLNDIPKELFELISWCEMPSYKNRKYLPCGKCGSCKKMDKALLESKGTD